MLTDCLLIPFRFFDDTVRFRAGCERISDFTHLSRKQYHKEAHDGGLRDLTQENGVSSERDKVNVNYKFQFNLPRGCMFPTTGGTFPAHFVRQASFGGCVDPAAVEDFLMQKADQNTCSQLESTYAVAFDTWWREVTLLGAQTRGASPASKAMRLAMKSQGASAVAATVNGQFKGNT